MNAHRIAQVLDILHQNQVRGVPSDAGRIARRLGYTATEVAEVLLDLDRKGLVDATRACLTMGGFVAATALTAELRTTLRHAA